VQQRFARVLHNTPFANGVANTVWFFSTLYGYIIVWKLLNGFINNLPCESAGSFFDLKALNIGKVYSSQDKLKSSDY
jgi:hypothetical protein